MNIYYDLTYFLKPVTESDKNSATEDIKEEIKKRNGVLIDESIPVKKNLSYLVLKYKDGFLGSIKFTAEPDNIELINKTFRKNENILRFSIKKIIKKEETISHKKKAYNHFMKKSKPVAQKQDENQLAEIDKKIDELLGK